MIDILRLISVEELLERPFHITHLCTL